MRKLLVAAALLGGLYALPSSAQPVVQNQLSGNEVWSAAQGPGGQSAFLGVNTVRGGTQAITGTVTGNVTLARALANGGNLIVTAQPSAATITLPANPVVDGAIVGVCNGTASAFATNVVTLAANSNQTLVQTVTLTTLGAGACARVQWNQSGAKWYRVQ